MVFDLLVYIDYLILGINMFLYMKTYSGQDKVYKFFSMYLFLTGIVQAVMFFLPYFHFQNLVMSHFYFIGQFVVLSFFYFALFKNENQKKMVKIGLVLGLLIFAIQFVNDPSLIFRFNLFEIFVTSFLLIVYATFHFYNMLSEKREFYYVNIGILMYLFGSTVLFFIGNLSSVLYPKMSFISWTLNGFLIVLYQVIILIEWKINYSKKRIK
jgi:hypothetical protein